MKVRRGLFWVGSVRWCLLMPFNCRWNMWVRDFTARIDGTWLICPSEEGAWIKLPWARFPVPTERPEGDKC